MTKRKILVTLLIIAVAVSGFVAGLVLLRERQESREEAATQTGQATVSIQPASGNFNVGDEIHASIFFNTANIPIAGIAVRLTYPFSGTTPEVTVSNIEINPAIHPSADWSCPTSESKQEGTNVVINIACANQSASGFLSSVDTLLANLTLRVNRAPSVSPLVIRFDQAASVIRRKSDNQDILLIPSSTGSYTIAGAQVTQPPSPTSQISGTKTPTPTKLATATPTRVATASPTLAPKGGEQLPDAGVSYPTFFGVGLGIMVIIGAILLAL